MKYLSHFRKMSQDCPEENNFCSYIYMNDSNQYAQANCIWIASCAHQNHCQDDECAERMCHADYQMCMSDTGKAETNSDLNPNPPSRSYSFEDIFWCANDCDEDLAYIQECLERETLGTQQVI